MVNLLLKEWRVNQSSIVIGVTIILLASVLFSEGQISLFFAIIVGCMYPFSTTQNDNFNNSDILINSLPIKPCTIVSSKYLFSLILGLVAVVMVTVINAIFPFFETNRFFEVILSISAIGWFIAIYYPLLYLVGQTFVTYGMVAFFILVLPIILDNQKVFRRLEDISMSQLSMAVFVITIIFLMISWYISGRIYLRKQW